MTETEPSDAVRWPDRVGDGNHPFGEITVGAMLCAYCAAGNVDTRWEVRVMEKASPKRITHIAAGSHRALLAAGCWPEKFLILDCSGYYMEPVAITSIGGTLVCKNHLYDRTGKLRIS